MLLVVRHADAGDKAAWKGLDRLRPLSSIGHRQLIYRLESLRAQKKALVSKAADFEERSGQPYRFRGIAYTVAALMRIMRKESRERLKLPMNCLNVLHLVSIRKILKKNMCMTV